MDSSGGGVSHLLTFSRAESGCYLRPARPQQTPPPPPFLLSSPPVSFLSSFLSSANHTH